MENLVFLELFRGGIEARYYSINSEEVDFVFRENGKLKIIEVSYEADKGHVKKVIKAMEKLKTSEAIIVTWDEENLIRKGNKIIKVTPLWKWLLATKHE